MALSVDVAPSADVDEAAWLMSASGDVVEADSEVTFPAAPDVTGTVVVTDTVVVTGTVVVRVCETLATLVVRATVAVVVRGDWYVSPVTQSGISPHSRRISGHPSAGQASPSTVILMWHCPTGSLREQS